MSAPTPGCDCRIIWNAASQEQIIRCSLHAAAPELLEALEEVVQEHVGGWDYGATRYRALIAKAKGETA